MQQKSFKAKYVSIPFRVEVYIAWRNLITKKLRSFLTILGVIIGIGSIFFLLSLGLGLENLVTEEIVGNSSIKSIDVTSPNSRLIRLDDDNINKIRSISGVDKLGTSYNTAGIVSYNKSEINPIVYGVDTTYLELSDLNIVSGRLLQDDENDGVLVNRPVLEAIGIKDPKEAIDKSLNIKVPLSVAEDTEQKEINESLQIRGVIESGSGGEIFVANSLFAQASVNQYSQIKLLAKNTEDISELREKIHKMSFETASPIDTIDQIKQIFKYFNIILVGFGGIGMIVAVLGMFNTLTISLLERTREIGLMVALGARHKDMRTLFILEAVLLSVIGSVVGITLAVIAGNIVNLLMNHMARSNGVKDSFDLFATPLWLIAALITFMIMVGLLVVLLPARRAQKINPIDALRRE